MTPRLPPTAMVSVLILVRNEELDLPGCVASVAWCDDIHVLDSGSSDATVRIARAAGAHVAERLYPAGAKAFGGDESAHRNWSLGLPFKHPWLLLLDADERVTPELRDAVLRTAVRDGPEVAYRIRRRDHFLGTWLAHVQTSPLYLRLVRPSQVHYERLVNPVLVPHGSVGDLAGDLDHFPFSKGMHHWLDRHNAYSTLEAEQIMVDRAGDVGFSLRDAFFCQDFHRRRKHQKALFYRLPLRPLLKFLVLYVGKRGFLDGRAGFVYATLQSIYEYFIVLKTRELADAAGPATGAASPGRESPRADSPPSHRP